MGDRVGHVYSNITLTGNAQAHFGDTTITLQEQEDRKAEDKKYGILVQSLAFEGMDARVRNVPAALPTTCEWLRGTTQFQLWADSTRADSRNGLLWIKGKPGSGKTTIMRETLYWAEREWIDQTAISFFFNARATSDLEKSTLGLYRSLAYKLELNTINFRTIFWRMFSTKEKDGRVEAWTETELQNFLIRLAQESYLPELNLFIDALDEGEEADIRSMVIFLEQLFQHASATPKSFRLCLASRHYPHITISRSISLTLEDQKAHSADIDKYITAKLYGSLQSTTLQLRQTILHRSRGVFLWVVLVIPMLNRLHDRGRGISAMEAKLKTIPQDLHELFESLLRRSSEDLDECVTLLRWVFCAMRPLRTDELYLLVTHKHDISEFMDHVSQEPIHDRTVTQYDAMSRYILDCSRGLVEWPNRDQPHVQFIHETVRAALPSLHFSMPSQDYTNGDHSASFVFDPRKCQNAVAQDCLRYLRTICGMPILDELRYTSLLPHYAAKFWPQHVTAALDGVNDLTLDLAMELLTGKTGTFDKWQVIFDIDIEVDSKFFSNRHEIYRMEIYLQPGSPLYYAALIGLPSLFPRVLALGYDINCYGGRDESPLQAAALRGHEQMVKMLISAGADINPKNHRAATPLIVAAACGHTSVLRLLLDAGADLNVRHNWNNNSALQVASAHGHIDAARCILTALRAKCTTLEYKRALGEASSAAWKAGHRSFAIDLDHEIERLALHSEDISLRVNTLAAKWVTVEVSPDATAAVLKEIISKVDKHFPARACLLAEIYHESFGTSMPRYRRLADDVCLRDVYIRDSTRVDVLPPLWGTRREPPTPLANHPNAARRYYR